MIAWCARGITGWLIRCGAVRESDRELYVYAAYSFLITVSPLVLTLFIGTLLGKTWQSIVLILPFLLIRKFSGGVHAKHAFVCFVSSCLLLLLCIGLSGRIGFSRTLAAATAAAMVSLFLFSPVDSKNRRLDDDEKRRYHAVTGILTMAFGLFAAVLFFCGKESAAVCISLGIILIAGLQIPCIFSRLYLFFKKNDQNR